VLASVTSVVSTLAAILPQFPEWTTRIAGPFVVGVGVFTVNKFLGKWIDRRWPDRKKGNTKP
jgi:hypothetical protein